MKINEREIERQRYDQNNDNLEDKNVQEWMSNCKR